MGDVTRSGEPSGPAAAAGSPGAAGTEARRLAAALGDRANELAAQGRVAEVPALWEEAIAGLADSGSRDRITLAYAWYQALHGEAGHGIRLAAGLRDSAVGAVRGQIRVLLRNRWRVEPEVVGEVWSAETGTEPPDWVRLDEETVQAVADWVSAADWGTSQRFYIANVEALPVADVSAALEELLLGGGEGLRPRIALHRALLALGAPAAYPCLTSPATAATTAATAIARKDWSALHAVGTLEVLAHGRRYLGSVHVVAAEASAAGAGPIDPRVAGRLARLAEAATPEEREQAAADLRDLPAVAGPDAPEAGTRRRPESPDPAT